MQPCAVCYFGKITGKTLSVVNTQRLLWPHSSTIMIGCLVLSWRGRVPSLGRPAESVVVGTNFQPLWAARDGDRPVPLFEKDGQLAFQTPRGGTYDVALVYPKRAWLLWVAALSVIAGAAACFLADGRRPT